MHFIGPKNQIVVVFSIIPLEEKKSIEKNRAILTRAWTLASWCQTAL